MNQEEFESKIMEIRNRALSKALTPEEENSYTESLFESIKHVMNIVKNFGMQENYNSLRIF